MTGLVVIEAFTVADCYLVDWAVAVLPWQRGAKVEDPGAVAELLAKWVQERRRERQRLQADPAMSSEKATRNLWSAVRAPHP